MAPEDSPVHSLGELDFAKTLAIYTKVLTNSLSAHVGNNGTFRMRLLERQGINLDEVDDLRMFSYCLPRDPRYTGIDRAYREGVEYLVQKLLHTVRGRINPFMHVVSHVEYNDSAQLTFVKSTAQEIFDAFLNTFPHQ